MRKHAIMIYQTDTLTVDTGRYLLSQNDKPIEIEPQVFDLLVYLIENHNRVVTRRELLEKMWKGRVVSDSALNARLKAARKAVGDSGRTQSIIKTIHGRGYQFVASVKICKAAEPASLNVTSTGNPQIFDLSEKPSIAVLPFANISGDLSQAYFCDGLTEDIITQLSRFRDLFVTASNSSFVYKGKAVKIQEVGRELGVRYILEGSVQASNKRVRISAQLIDSQSGQHLWAERYDRRLDDIFEVQDEVTNRVVGTLASGYGGRLRKAWQKQTQGIRSRNARAFDYFMRGLDAVDHFTLEGNRQGRKFFEQAIELDPNYAKAYGKLAWTYFLDAVEGWDPRWEKAIEKGHEFSLKGIEIDDNESWVHWSLGAYYVYVGKHDAAIFELERAVELNPNDADVLTDYGIFLSYSGRAKEGIAAALKAMQLNPHYPEWYTLQLVQIYHDARQYEDAVVTFQRQRTIDTTLVRLYLAASHAALGNTGEARRHIERVLQLDPDATLKRWTDFKLAPYKIPEDLQHFRDNLHRAGLR